MSSFNFFGGGSGATAATQDTQKVVADQTARFALTTDDSTGVQNGDTVYQTDTGATYLVVDDTNLDSAAGYHLLPGSSSGDIVTRRQVLNPGLHDSKTGTLVWTGNTSADGGGYWYNSSAALNDRLDFEEVALVPGGVTVRVQHLRAGAGGVATVYWGEDALGDIEMRAGSLAYNVASDVTSTILAADTRQLSLRIEGTTGAGYTYYPQKIEVIQPEA